MQWSEDGENFRELLMLDPESQDMYYYLVPLVNEPIDDQVLSDTQS